MSLRHDEWLAGSAGRVRFAVTDRAGGSSRTPYDEANLGGHVGDDPADVERNRAALAELLSLPRERLVFMSQVHGQQVVQVDRPWTGPAPEADAMVSTTPGLAFAVLVADCVPVLLADPDAGVVGVAHAGRPGLAAGVVPAAVAAMRDLGAAPDHRPAGPLGLPPLLRGAGADEGGRRIGRARGVRDRPARPAGAGHRGRRPGPAGERVLGPGPAARLHARSPELYSHRRDGVTGRFAGVVVLA